MESPQTSSQLKQLIIIKEAERANDGQMIKEQFNLARRSFAPANLIKLALSKATTSSDFKSEMVKVAVELITSFVTKKMFQRKAAENKKIQSDLLLELIIEKVMLQHAEEIKTIGKLMLKK